MPEEGNDHLLGQAHVLHPLVAQLDFLAMELPLVIVQAVEGLGEGLVGGVGLGCHAGEHQLLDVDVAVGRGMVADALHQALALPVAVGALHLLLGHAQLSAQACHVHVRLGMAALGQAIEVHLDIVAFGCGQVLQNKLVVHRRYVKNGVALIKPEHAHFSLSLLWCVCYYTTGSATA